MSRKTDDLVKILAAVMALYLLLNLPIIWSPPPQGNGSEQHAQTKSEGQQPDSWWYSFFSGVRATDTLLALFTGALVIVGWVQATRLRQSINTQTRDMGFYVTEAKRAADAMEGVANSMTTNVERLGETVAINRDIAERQKLYGQTQLRAYIGVLGFAFFDQTDTNDAQCITRLINTGHTPAKNLSFRGVVDVRHHPQRADFDFTLPALAEDRSVTTVGTQGWHDMVFFTPRRYTPEEIAEFHEGGRKRIYCYGRIEYNDAFDQPHYINFCYSVFRNAAGNPVCVWTRRHNDSN